MAYTPSAGLFNPNKSYSSMTPGGFNNLGSTPGVLNQPTPNATSVATKQPVYVPPTIPSPANSSTAPVKKTVTTTSQGDKHEVHYDNGTSTGNTSTKTATPETPASTSAGLSPGETTYNPDGSVKASAVSNPQSATPTPPTPTPTPPTFPGMISGLTGAATGVDPNVATGQTALAGAIEKQRKLESDIAAQYGNIESQAIPLNFQQGREQALARQYASQESAAQGAVTAAQTALGQGVTARGQTLGALQGAANLAQPSATSQGQTTYDPLTNSFSGGSYSGNLQTVVDAIKSGNMGYTDGVNSLASLSPTAKADVLKALGSGFDTVASDATAATRGGVIGTQGAQVAQYKSALQQGQNLQSQLTDLITSFGLNPNDVNKVNSGLQVIANNVSDPHYKILQNYVNDIANTYAQVLTPPGGSATDTTRGIASSMLDASMAGNGLITVMKSLDDAANAKIAGIPTTNTSTSGSTGGTMFGSFFGK